MRTISSRLILIQPVIAFGLAVALTACAQYHPALSHTLIAVPRTQSPQPAPTSSSTSATPSPDQLPNTDGVIPPSPPADLTPELTEELNLLNEVRARYGMARLEINPTLSSVAQKYAEQMMTEKFFAHVDPNGVNLATRLRQAGLSVVIAGENIALALASPAEVMDAWMDSDGHRANILNSSFGHVGLGKAGNYWVQDFSD